MFQRVIKSTIVKNTFWLYGIQVFGYVLPILLIPFLSSTLKSEVFGYYILLEAFGAWIGVFYEYGFNLSGTRDIAQNKKDVSKRVLIVAKVLKTQVILLIISFFLIPVLFFVFPKILSYPQIFCLLLVKVFLDRLSPLWYFVGMEKIQIPSLINMLSRFIAVALILVCVRNPNDLSLVYLLQILFILIALFLNFYKVFQETPLKIGVLFALRGSYINTNFKLFVLRLSGGLYSQASTLLFSNFATLSEVGYYGATEKIVRAANRVFTPLIQTVFPRISSLIKTDPNKASNYLKKATVVFFLIGLFVSVGLIVFSEYIIEYIMRYDINDKNVRIFRLFALLPIVLSVGTSYGTLNLIVRKMEHLNLIAIGFGSVITILLTVLLAEKYGSMGMVLTLLLTEFFVALMLIIFSKIFKK